MNERFINFTPHNLNILTREDGFRVLPRSGRVLSAPGEERKIAIESDCGIQVYKEAEKKISGDDPQFAEILKIVLFSPKNEFGKVFGVVSRAVKESLPKEVRKNFLCPGEPIRDSEGYVTGYDGLSF